MYFGLILSFSILYILFLELGTTELNSTFETTANATVVPLPGQIDLSLAPQ